MRAATSLCRNSSSSSVVASVQKQCSCSLAAVQQQCSSSVAEVQQQCSSSVAAVQQKCSSSIAAVQQQCSSSVAAVQQHSSVAAVQHQCSIGAIIITPLTISVQQEAVQLSLSRYVAGIIYYLSGNVSYSFLLNFLLAFLNYVCVIYYLFYDF